MPINLAITSTQWEFFMKKIILLSAVAMFSLTSVQSFACGDHNHGKKKKTIITEATKTTAETKK